jgi:hypothetical protein
MAAQEDTSASSQAAAPHADAASSQREAQAHAAEDSSDVGGPQDSARAAVAAKASPPARTRARLSVLKGQPSLTAAGAGRASAGPGDGDYWQAQPLAPLSAAFTPLAAPEAVIAPPRAPLAAVPTTASLARKRPPGRASVVGQPERVVEVPVAEEDRREAVHARAAAAAEGTLGVSAGPRTERARPRTALAIHTVEPELTTAAPPAPPAEPRQVVVNTAASPVWAAARRPEVTVARTAGTASAAASNEPN